MILLAAFATLAAIGLVSTLVSLATDARRRLPTDPSRIPARDGAAAETRVRVRDRGARRRVSVARPGLAGTR
ncbi:hypothetical protein RZO50_05020 [Microbacterium sp. SSW1-59]|uniref:hypothetical protein n=1 Tax=Microbacterium xanthum TaxID=3079794 RepID=UPI002AD559D5|nr:hypothetical protein [Microbacterium sp. SSW1-59]MDZ8200860.1 hypothetical protein [Microbacterium sp. SSW1-59]